MPMSRMTKKLKKKSQNVCNLKCVKCLKVMTAGSPMLDQEYLPLSVCLHAWKLSYLVASAGEYKTFEAALPENELWVFSRK